MVRDLKGGARNKEEIMETLSCRKRSRGAIERQNDVGDGCCMYTIMCKLVDMWLSSTFYLDSRVA